RDPEPLPAIEGLPAEVADLYRRCLARDPADRPTAAEFADVLRPAAADTLDPAAIGVGGAEPGTLTQILPTITATADMAMPRRRLWPAATFALTAGLLLSAAFP